ncbi:MAG: NAD(P)H-hydrate dehydratase [Arenimonas sp.]|nr:NAD(P)H-hydrate dehydratase [Arenimonas sp.]
MPRYHGLMTLNKRQLLKILFARPSDSHKYDYGRVFIIGGSQSMAGAPVLAGKAALRSGAGLVELCVPDCVVTVAASFDPCLITHSVVSDAHGCMAPASNAKLLQLAANADVLVCGPGMGRSPELVALVKKLWQEMPQTLIVDADALFALSLLDNDSLVQHVGARIITPHAGEMQRLLAAFATSADEITSDHRSQLELAAQDFASRYRAMVVLKGPKTFITDGNQHSHNLTGNPGMATAGSGDVLSGIIAALMGQGLPAFEAVELAVYAHGLAGDLAANNLTELSVTANDLIGFLPQAWLKLKRELDAE